MASKRERMKRLYDAADNIRPFAEIDGHKYVSFEDAAVLNSLDAEEPSGTGIQTRNPDGSIASTGKTTHAINPDYFFANRYMVKGKKMHVVSGHEPTGYRCIKEQASGHIFVKTVPVYVFSRNEDKQLVLDKVTTVSDTEFVSDFTKTLGNEAMAELLPMITASGSKLTADAMPI